MRVLERRPGGFSVVLENQDVLKSPVLLQIENAVPKRPQHIFNTLWRQSREARVVIWRLDDDLVCADAIHLVEHALSLAVQRAFNAKRGKLVGHNSYRPTR